MKRRVSKENILTWIDRQVRLGGSKAYIVNELSAEEENRQVEEVRKRWIRLRNFYLQEKGRDTNIR